MPHFRRKSRIACEAEEQATNRLLTQIKDGAGPELLYLAERIQFGILKHQKTIDMRVHNYGTITAIAAATSATIVPDSLISRSLAGLGAVIVAGMRGLDFGARCRWHLDMRYCYATLLGDLAAIDIANDSQMKGEMRAVRERLKVLQLKESSIPGTGQIG